MHLTQIAPSPCTHCGNGNNPKNDGSRLTFVDLERDINWNDPLILCEECIMKLGGLIGMPNPELLYDKDREIAALTKRIHRLQTTIDSMKKRGKKLGIVFTKDKAVA